MSICRFIDLVIFFIDTLTVMSQRLSFFFSQGFLSYNISCWKYLDAEKEIWIILYLISMYKPQHLTSKKIAHVLSEIRYGMSSSLFVECHCILISI